MYLYMTSWEHVRHSNISYATACSIPKCWQSCPYLSNATLQTPIYTEMQIQKGHSSRKSPRWYSCMCLTSSSRFESLYR
jgi:hypothetical protein